MTAGAPGGRGMEFEHGLRDSMGGVAASGIGDGKRGFGNGTAGKASPEWALNRRASCQGRPSR